MPSSEVAWTLLRIAGCAIWCVVVAGPAVALVGGRGWITGPGSWLWPAAAVAWIVAFVYWTRPSRGRPFPKPPVWGLVVETAAALTIAVLRPGEFDAVLVIPIAAQAGFALPPKAAVGWVGIQTVGLLALGTLLTPVPIRTLVVLTVAQTTFQIFAVGAAILGVGEAQARRDLAWMNAGLLATRDLLAESTRRAERLRISRELHDSLGHRLTALSLELEAAGNRAEGAVADAVRAARERTDGLLVEVRGVVASVRDDGPYDLRRALRTLSLGSPSLRVHLGVDDHGGIESAEVAHVLFRCVQEIITNAARHAEARNLWVDLRRDGGEVVLEARDDGKGAARLELGNGLNGMRERLEEIGGRLTLTTSPGLGLSVHVVVPLRKPS